MYGKLTEKFPDDAKRDSTSPMSKFGKPSSIMSVLILDDLCPNVIKTLSGYTLRINIPCLSKYTLGNTSINIFKKVNDFCDEFQSEIVIMLLVY